VGILAKPIALPVEGNKTYPKKHILGYLLINDCTMDKPKNLSLERNRLLRRWKRMLSGYPLKLCDVFS
jgi:hypothetical protein